MIFKKFFEKIFLLKRIYFYLFLLFLSIVIFFIGALLIKLSASGDDGFGSFFVALVFLIFLSTILFIINVVFISIYEGKSKTKNPLIMILYILLIVFLISYGVFGDAFFLKELSNKYDIHPEKYLRNKKIDNFIKNNNIEGCINYVDDLDIKMRQPYDDPEFIEKQFKFKCKEGIAYNLNDLTYCHYNDIAVTFCYYNVLMKIELNNNDLDTILDRDKMLVFCEQLREFEIKDSYGQIDKNTCIDRYKNKIIDLKGKDKINGKNLDYRLPDFPDKELSKISKDFGKNIINKNISEIKSDFILFNWDFRLDTNTLFFEEIYLDTKPNSSYYNFKKYMLIIDKLESKIINLEDIFFDVNSSLSKISLITKIDMNIDQCPSFYFNKESITFLCDSPDYNISVSFNDFSTSDINFEKLNTFFP